MRPPLLARLTAVSVLVTVSGCAGLFKPPETRIQEVSSVKFTPDGSRVVASYFVTVIREDSEGVPDEDTQSMIRVFDASSGQQLQNIRRGDGIWDIDISPDGRVIAAPDWDSKVRLYDLHSGALLRELVGHTGSAFSVAYSPDGGLLASGGFNRGILLWNPHTGVRVRTLTGHSDAVYAVEFSPDGRVLASSGSQDGTVRLWDALNGSLIRTFDTGKAFVTDIDFSPDGRLLAVGADRSVLLIDLQAGVQVEELTGHHGQVISVAFHPDGNRLASAAGEGDWDILLRDLRDASAIQELDGHRGQVYSLAWSPNGSRLASGSADNTAKLWNPETGRQIWSVR